MKIKKKVILLSKLSKTNILAFNYPTNNLKKIIVKLRLRKRYIRGTKKSHYLKLKSVEATQVTIQEMFL